MKLHPEIKDRLSNKTTPKGWKRVRNIAGIIATAGSLVLAAPVSLPAAAISWITYTILVTGTIAGTSHLTKK
jgi:hypothetical protein